MSRTRARELRRIVRPALKTAQAIRWRERTVPRASRWDDGPCYEVAMAIACFDDYRGEVRTVDMGEHALYHVGDGWCVDGHRIERHKDLEFPDRFAPKRAPTTLVRVMRNEAKRAARAAHRENA